MKIKEPIMATEQELTAARDLIDEAAKDRLAKQEERLKPIQDLVKGTTFKHMQTKLEALPDLGYDIQVHIHAIQTGMRGLTSLVN
jgi:hypothetical protein